MEAKETDKLFREKLRKAPSAPTAESWGKLESMLEAQKKAPVFTMWRVAAAILLLIVSGWIVTFWNKGGQVPNEVAHVTLPSESIQNNNAIVPTIDVKEEEYVDGNQTQIVQEKSADKPVRKQKAIPVMLDKKVVEEPLETKGLEPIEGQSLTQVEILEPELEEIPQKKRFKTIKITYKRGRKPLHRQEEMMAQQKADTTGNKKIRELWDQTREIKPGDLWADIRDAKDNLFQRNSKK